MASKSLSVSILSTFKHLLQLGGRNWWLSFLLWIILVGPVQAAVELRVAIKKNVNQVKVGSSTTAIVKDAAGRKLGEIAAMNAFSAQPSGGGISVGKWKSGQIFIEPTGDGYVWISDRWYRGRTRLVRKNKGIMAINHVELEDYLYSVVGAEAIPSWPLEALKAQAVAARSYALHKRYKSGNSMYDLDTTTVTQVYKGLDSEYTSTHQAVDGTSGQVMTYNRKVILAVFHSSSGGHTENVEDIWMRKLPYLRGVNDYDQGAPVYEWTKSFSPSQLSSLISGVGTVKSMRPEKTTPQGRVLTMKVIGSRGTKRLSGDQMRSALNLRSTLFSVSSANGKFEVYGKGFGHGVGLSQWGAHNLAQKGINYQQILGHYYQNATLAKIDPKGR
ncbi:MAG: SpoIID/LytB domain-containing protein [Moorea sp. SIO2B7]|nr:SpoIID/LytB domain-containing protein [Moorena sp. SIO2B7]